MTSTKLTKQSIELHSLHIIFLLLFGLIFGSIIGGILLQKVPLLIEFDKYFYTLIHHGPHYKFIDLIISPFNYNFLPPELSPLRMPSYYYFMFLLSFIYVYLYRRSLTIWLIFAFALGTLLSMAIAALDWHFIFRERPFLTLPNTVDQTGQNAWKLLSSYPSGHTRETALYATIISNFIPQLKWPLFIFCIFIALSRIYVGAHFPTDVIAGLLIGYLTAKVTLIISREIQILIDSRGGVGHHEHPKELKA